MLALYEIEEYGQHTDFLLKNSSGDDMPWLFIRAADIVRHNGGSLTEAFAEATGLDDARALVRLTPMEGEVLNQVFGEEHSVTQRIVIHTEEKKLSVEHDRQACNPCIEDGVRPLPKELVRAVEEGRQAPTIRLKDLVLLGLPPSDVFMVHESAEVGRVPATSLYRLSLKGVEEFAPLLAAKVNAIRPGAYGMELELCGVSPHMLVKYDECLAKSMSVGRQFFRAEEAGQGLGMQRI